MDKHRQALDLLFLSVTNGDELRRCSEQTVRTFTVDVYHDDRRYVIFAELNGLRCSDIEVVYEDNYLEIIGKKSKPEIEGLTLLRGERCFGEFRRSFFIEGIDPSSITAELQGSVLRIDIMKA